MNDLIIGAAAGCIATVPMTLAMGAMHGELPPEEQYPLPPRTVTMRVAEEAGVKDDLDEGERTGLTFAAHFGMGTAAGAMYGPVSRLIPLPAPLAGAAFGLAVWAGNYLGLLPALGLLRPATEHPPRRTGLMIAAHLVWGAATGIAVGLARDADRTA
ncbi:MAG: hypothetical protein JWO38_5808 [Gemmataceae bacterium]|nr:hypothetical protein [Gemmataceae bacterium]